MVNTAGGKKPAAEETGIDPESSGSLQIPQATGFLQNTLIHVLLIVVLGSLAYSNTFSIPFQFDDQSQIFENPLIYDFEHFLSDFRGYDYAPRRFIGYLTFALNYNVGGTDVTGYHIVNLVIHLMNALMVYFMVKLTFRTPYFSNQQSASNDQQSTVKRKKSVVSSKKEETDDVDDRQKSNHTGIAPTHYSRFTIHDSQFIALFSALLFVSHPLQTQAVTYIVQRITSLATFFYLLCLLLYIKGRLLAQQGEYSRQYAVGSREGKKGATAYAIGSRRFPAYCLLPTTYFLLSLFSAVLAMRTKEISLTLPLIIVLYELIFFRASFKMRLLFLLPILLTLIIIPAGLLHSDRPLGEILSDISATTRDQTQISRGDYLMTQMRVITTYIRLIFLPINQNLDYDYPIYHSLLTQSVFLSFVFLLSILGLGVYLLYKAQRAECKEQRTENKKNVSKDDTDPERYALSAMPYAPYYCLIAFGIFWFFITLSVESSIIPIADVIFEHRAYLPSVGAFTAITSSLFLIKDRLKHKFPKIKAAFLPVFFIIIMALSVVTYARNIVWQDEISLWSDTVLKSPGKARGHVNLGFAYLKTGAIDKAVEQVNTALQLDPYSISVEAHNYLAVAYTNKGELDKAIEECTKALAINSTYVPALKNRGMCYADTKQLEAAVADFRRACDMGDREGCMFLNYFMAARNK